MEEELSPTGALPASPAQPQAPEAMQSWEVDGGRWGRGVWRVWGTSEAFLRSGGPRRLSQLGQPPPTQLAPMHHAEPGSATRPLTFCHQIHEIFKQFEILKLFTDTRTSITMLNRKKRKKRIKRKKTVIFHNVCHNEQKPFRKKNGFHCAKVTI